LGLGALFGGRSGLDEAADQVALDFARGGAAAVLCGGDGVHARRGGGVGAAAAVQGCSAVPNATYYLHSGLPDPHYVQCSTLPWPERPCPSHLPHSTLSHVCNVINFGMNVFLLM
jgi:hypothetical protein